MNDQRSESRLVAERLTRAGLVGPAFDADDILTDYAARMEMDRSLDALIGPCDPGAAGRPPS